MTNTLTSINVSRNPKISSPTWKVFFQSLELLNSLEHLNLEFCSLDNDRIRYLTNSLNVAKSTLTTNIRSLRLLGSYKVKQEIWIEIFKSFNRCQKLEFIGLEFCNLNSSMSQVIF